MTPVNWRRFETNFNLINIQKYNLDSTIEYSPFSIKTKPGSISGAEVYTNSDTGAPVIDLLSANILIQYQVIEQTIYRFVSVVTSCGHITVLESGPYPYTFLNCHCTEGCLTDFKTSYKEYLTKLVIKSHE